MRSGGAIRRGSILPGISLIIAILLALFVLPSPWGLVVVLCACVLEVVEITWGLRLARRRSSVGAHTLIGRQAVVVRELDPIGQVTIDGERWKAHCATGAAVGAKVVIESIDGLTLEVRVYTSVSERGGGRRGAQRLKHDAVALGQLEQLVELLLRRVAGELERQADVAEADGRLAVDAERAAEVEIALGAYVRGGRARRRSRSRPP